MDFDADKLRRVAQRRKLAHVLSSLRDAVDTAIDALDYVGDVEMAEEREMAREEAADDLSRVVDEMDALTVKLKAVELE